MTRILPAIAGLLAVSWMAAPVPTSGQAPPTATPATFLQTFDSMQDVQSSWTMSSWTNSNRAHAAENVSVADGVLTLKLSGSRPGEKPVCAEIVSRRNDFFYGTYRASIRTTATPGAIAGWFTYLGNPLNEIDVELLSRDSRLARFTLHHIKTGVDHGRKELPFDPSAGFHEYRFDWYADRVVYFVDGELSATLTKEVPDRPSRLLLNHWSGNIPTFGGAAPTEDAFMQVDWVYFSPDYRDPPPGAFKPAAAESTSATTGR